MNYMQKRAWASLFIWPFLAFMTIIVFKSTIDDFDLRIILYVVGLLALAVISGVIPIICQKYLPALYNAVQRGCVIAYCGFRNWKKIPFDERDRAIKEKANLAGYIAAYSLYVGVCMIASSIDSIPGSKLILVFVAGTGTHIFTRSLALLILYGWEGKNGKQ